MTNSKLTTPKPFCFVLMPFSEEFDDVYRIGIKEACDKANAYCERVDEQIFNERIIDRVYNQIAKADIVIADMTGRNPNVFYEVGYAHALGKLTILLTRNADDIPFDLKHFPHIIYGTKVSLLRDELEKRVKHFIENPPDGISETKPALELYLEKENLASGKAVCSYGSGGMSVVITVYNSSNNTIASEDFKVGIITQARRTFNYGEVRIDDGSETIKLPTDENLHMMPDFPDLFPNGYASRFIKLSYENGSQKVIKEESIQVRLFTIQGSKDFQISVEKKNAA